ncbi:site-specific integrase [Cellulosimicrobium sp. KWT-B]|uniref:site-specific integrase n=1 Tax=Cellulosimicrobium sp. KWT-B TaxID=1981152 RepID=UPI00130266B4|nr:site-specific integrase [Cellulosimicrobium sp. KWT-B]
MNITTPPPRPSSDRRKNRPSAPPSGDIQPNAVWNAEQVRSFCTWALDTSRPWALAWSILARTGLRSGELLGMEWHDVDLDAGTLTIRQALHYSKAAPHGQRPGFKPPKHDHVRTILLDATTREHFAAIKGQRLDFPAALGTEHRDLVFPPGNGRSASQSALLSAFRRDQELYSAANPGAELPGLTVKDLRHTHAALLFALGADPRVVQERLGHSSPDVTYTTYAHLMIATRQGATKWPDYLGEAV